MWEFQATATSKHYLRFIITCRKNIFKQLSLTPFSVTNLVIKVRQKAGVTIRSVLLYTKLTSCQPKCEQKNAAFSPITELQRPSNMPCLAMDRKRDESDRIKSNQTNYLIVRLKVDQRAGQLMLPHLEWNSEKVMEGDSSVLQVKPACSNEGRWEGDE